jgi:hypothetical protein
MDLANIGRQTQDDMNTRAIRGVIIQKLDALKCMEREMAQLAENKREIEGDLFRLGVALAPITMLNPPRLLTPICSRSSTQAASGTNLSDIHM